MHSLFAALMGGFLLGFGIAIGNDWLVWGSPAFLLLAGLLRWCEKQEG